MTLWYYRILCDAGLILWLIFGGGHWHHRVSLRALNQMGYFFDACEGQNVTVSHNQLGAVPSACTSDYFTRQMYHSAFLWRPSTWRTSVRQKIPSSPEDMSDTEPLVVIWEHVQASRYVDAVGIVVCTASRIFEGPSLTSEYQALLYDHILTFDDEVRLIWRAKTTFPKVLFLINRYMVPASIILKAHGMEDF